MKVRPRMWQRCTLCSVLTSALTFSIVASCDDESCLASLDWRTTSPSLVEHYSSSLNLHCSCSGESNLSMNASSEQQKTGAATLVPVRDKASDVVAFEFCGNNSKKRA